MWSAPGFAGSGRFATRLHRRTLSPSYREEESSWSHPSKEGATPPGGFSTSLGPSQRWHALCRYLRWSSRFPPRGRHTPLHRPSWSPAFRWPEVFLQPPTRHTLWVFEKGLPSRAPPYFSTCRYTAVGTPRRKFGLGSSEVSLAYVLLGRSHSRLLGQGHTNQTTRMIFILHPPHTLCSGLV